VEQVGEGLQIREAQQSATSVQDDKGVGEGDIRPCGGEGTHGTGAGVMEKDAGLTPSQALGNQRKHLTGERVEGMGHGEDNVAIHAIGCS
jgi:hypothetical protein